MCLDSLRSLRAGDQESYLLRSGLHLTHAFGAGAKLYKATPKASVCFRNILTE